jgi:hypothetical protein
MRAYVFLIALLLLFQPAPPPDLAARWQSPTVARITWSQPAGVALTCLHRNVTLLTCWRDLPPERYVFTLGDKGPLDAAAHPAVGDVYVLDQDGVVSRAPLLFELALPIMRR